MKSCWSSVIKPALSKKGVEGCLSKWFKWATQIGRRHHPPLSPPYHYPTNFFFFLIPLQVLGSEVQNEFYRAKSKVSTAQVPQEALGRIHFSCLFRPLEDTLGSRPWITLLFLPRLWHHLPCLTILCPSYSDICDYVVSYSDNPG